MAAINTLIKEINNKLQNNEFDKAFDLYSEFLKDKHDYWKIKIIKNIIETIERENFTFMFTQNYADLFILDTKNHQFLIVWLSSNSLSVDHSREQYRWKERAREYLEEESLMEYGYSVNVLLIKKDNLKEKTARQKLGFKFGEN